MYLHPDQLRKCHGCRLGTSQVQAAGCCTLLGNAWPGRSRQAPDCRLRVHSEAPSLTCSMYTLVRLGMFKGMSCSGGGPEAWLLTSSDALLGSILTSSAPAQ